ncbi:M42 family metallopeptidase [Candidatus Bipolaricaulota bacterium]|nr:M42 family metallopeptidase [Candidatus Bipolaricaulota bacterium]HHR85765.1 M42 family peptidase [Candidatus Acetothermia bacterium]
MELLKHLSEAAGVPGHEGEIRGIISEALKDRVEKVEIDSLGNLIAHIPGDGPVVMIAAHMDEIGFIVSYIEKDTGFLRIHPLGGFDVKTLISQRVVVHTESGDLVGCIGAKPIHIMTAEERKKLPEMKDLFVDLGLKEDRVRELVGVGDMVTMRQDFVVGEEIVSGKALDDRAGLYIGIEAIKRAKKLDCDLYFVGTTQEEVGLRGAQVAGFAVHPDIAVALDTTLAVDMPGVPGAQQVTKLGGGVAIKIADSSSISHVGLVKVMKGLAMERKISYQMEILPRGGTDAGAMQRARSGSAAITLSLPSRYVHSVVEMAHQDDIEAAISLLAAFLETASGVDLNAG